MKSSHSGEARPDEKMGGMRGYKHAKFAFPVSSAQARIMKHRAAKKRRQRDGT